MKYLGYALLSTAMIGGLTLGIAAWAHPDMTERRLFLTYWREGLVCIALAISGAAILQREQ